MNWHDYFTYNEATGDLIWKERSLSSFAEPARGKIWNKRFSGKIAGHKQLWKGRPWRVAVSVGKVSTGAHRIIWQMLHGVIPSGMDVDHKDGNPWNNREQNLRPCTRQQNCSNKRVLRSGLKGVTLNKGRYCATVSKDGKKHFLGSFDSEHEAHEAYKLGAVKHFGEYARFE